MLLLYMIYIVYTLIGGRGRAGAGRRGKTVSLSYDIFIYILISEEGAGREPVGGEDGEFHTSREKCICI